MFLDEGFSAPSVAVRLRTAGFTVQRFHEWFTDENGVALRNVPDGDVIKFCHKNQWLLVTRDHEMRTLHREEIRRSQIAILATANNNQAGLDEWVAAIINLKARILREFKKRERPWFATFSRSATLTIQTIK